MLLLVEEAAAAVGTVADADVAAECERPHRPFIHLSLQAKCCFCSSTSDPHYSPLCHTDVELSRSRLFVHVVPLRTDREVMARNSRD